MCPAACNLILQHISLKGLNFHLNVSVLMRMRLALGWSPDQSRARTTVTISNLSFPVIELYNMLKRRKAYKQANKLTVSIKLFF